MRVARGTVRRIVWRWALCAIAVVACTGTAGDARVDLEDTSPSATDDTRSGYTGSADAVGVETTDDAPSGDGVASHCETDSDCDDGDPCNGREVGGPERAGSDARGCAAGPLPVAPGPQCYELQCTPGEAPRFVVAVGAACDDGSACTAGDTCRSEGQCLGTPIPCDDGVTCNGFEGCDVKTGCRPAVTVVAPTDENPDDCLVLGPCDPPAFDWPWVPVADGAPCSDGDVCTLDLCLGGECISTPAIDCDDGNPCLTDVCSPADGSCSHALVAYETPCDDGELCSMNDACYEGECLGQDGGCEDGDLCTYELCKGPECLHVPMDCPEKPCFTVACEPTVGCLWTPVVCPEYQCVIEECVPDPNGWYCAYIGLGADGTACDDGEPCSVNDRCTDVPGQCQGFWLAEGAACDDGEDCTDNDVCDKWGYCEGESTCDDGDTATYDLCWYGKCLFVPADDTGLPP
jgi:hypothetical protein